MTSTAKARLRKLRPQFLLDAKGKRTSVLLSTRQYEELIEDLVDLAAVAERRNERTYSMAEVKAILFSGRHA